MNCETCIKSEQINYLEKEIIELKEDRDKTQDGMHKIELTVTKIEGKMDVMSAKLDPFIQTVKSVEKDNKENQGKPGKLFDKIVSGMFTAVFASLVGAIMALVLK
jgi:translation elongation factor EF-Ts